MSIRSFALHSAFVAGYMIDLNVMETERNFNEKQGHWMLARLGKRVLRPGGIELTKILMRAIDICPEDDVVEFAPGLGLTANMACSWNPRSYTGVDRNEEAIQVAKSHINFKRAQFIIGDAERTRLADRYATKVYGEAMLTMHPMCVKRAVIHEAARILKPGGYYGMHELCLQPEDISEPEKRKIFKDLGANMRVHANPLTIPEWRSLLDEEGFDVLQVDTRPMALLEFKRVIQDEGILRTIKIIFNILTHKALRKRILSIREMFRMHSEDIDAVVIIARKR